MLDELPPKDQLQLQVIDFAVSRLIAIVEEAIAAAATALLSADDGAAAVVASRRTEIKELHRSIESLIVTELVRHEPVGHELRFLIGVLRIVPEVELTAALAGDIGRRGAMHIGPELPPRVRGLLGQLFTQTGLMWHRAADAYRDRAPDVLVELEADDEEIDELHASLVAELVSGDLRRPVLVEMALVARFLERLGDHAVEVARWVESFSVS